MKKQTLTAWKYVLNEADVVGLSAYNISAGFQQMEIMVLLCPSVEI